MSTEGHGLAFNWVEVKMARYEMGSNRLAGQPDDDEGPARNVTVGAFAITSNPITNKEFGAFEDATGYLTTAQVKGSGLVGVDEEAERVPGATWRAPQGPGTQSNPLDPVVQVSWFDATEFSRWSGTKLPTEAQWERAARHFHWTTSCWQWCQDFYHPTFHQSEQRVNPSGPESGRERVLRGGSPYLTERGSRPPDVSSDQIGFRVVRGRH